MGNKGNEAIIALSMVLEANAKNLSKEAQAVVNQAQKNVENISVGIDTSKIAEGFKEINDLAKGVLKDFDLTRQFNSVFEVFADSTKSAEDYINKLKDVKDELTSISKIGSNEKGAANYNTLRMLTDFNSRELSKVLTLQKEIDAKRLKGAEAVSKVWKKAEALEAFSIQKLRGQYSNDEKYVNATKEDTITGFLSNMGIDKQTNKVKQEIKEYSELTSLFNILVQRKEQFGEITTKEDAEENVRITKTLLSLYKQIEEKRKNLASKYNVKDTSIGLPDNYKEITGYDVIGSINEYIDKIIKPDITKDIAKYEEKLDDYIKKRANKHKERREAQYAKNYEQFDKESQNKTHSGGDSGDDGSGRGGFRESDHSGGVVNPEDIQNVKKLEQSLEDANERIKILEETLNSVSKEGKEGGLNLWEQSLESLKEEFADVIEYAVDAETALKKFNELGEGIESGEFEKNSQEWKDFMGFGQRLLSLDENALDNNLYEDFFWLNEEEYEKTSSRIGQMTQEQLEKIEKIKVAINEILGQSASYDDSTSTPTVENQAKDATDAVENLQKAEKDASEGAEQLEQKLVNSLNVGQKEISESINLVKELADKLGSAEFSENLLKNHGELVSAFKNIADEFGLALRSNLTEFVDTLNDASKEEFSFDNIRNTLLDIVKQFQNSLETVGLSSTQLDDAYKTIKGWTDASNIIVGSGRKDSERAALIGRSTGKVSNTYLYDKEDEFSGEILNQLNRLSAGVSGEISEIYDTWLHSHPLRKMLENYKTVGSDVAFSADDFNVYMNKYFEKGITNMMVTSNGKYTNIDWTGIVDKEVIKRVKEIFQKSDIFVDGKFKGGLVESNGIHDFDKQTELFNAEIIKAMQAVGIKDASARVTTGSIEDLKIDLSEVYQEEQKVSQESQELLVVIKRIEESLDALNKSGSFKFEGLDTFIANLEEVSKLLFEIRNAFQDGININVSSADLSVLDKAEEEIDSVNLKLQESKKYVNDVRQAFMHIVGGASDRDVLLEKYPELSDFKNRTSINNARSFLDTDEWNDFLSTLPKAHDYLESIGYDFERIYKLTDEEIEWFKNLSPEELLQHQWSTTGTPHKSDYREIRAAYQEYKKEDCFTETQIPQESADMDKLSAATDEAVQAKKDFASANEGVKDSVDGSKSKLALEAELMESIAKNAREAAEAKKEFVEANKQVKDSADDSNSKMSKKSKGSKKSKEQDVSEFIEEPSGQLSMFDGVVESQKEVEQAAKLTNEALEGQINMFDYLDEKRNQKYALIEEPSGQMSMFEGMEESQREVEQAVEKTNDALEGQITLTDHLAQIEKRNEYQKNVSDYVTSAKKSLDNLSGATNKTKDYENAIVEIRKEIENLESKKIDFVDQSAFDELDKAQIKINKMIASLKGDEFKLVLSKEADSLSTKMSRTLNKNTAMPKDLKNQLVDLRNELDRLRNSADGINKVQLDKIRSEFAAFETQLERTGKTGLSMADKIKKKFKDLAAYFATYVSIQDAIQVARQAYQYVAEIDKQMIELEKVSDMSDARLAKSFEHSTEAAKDLGSTISDVISATADWSRLGYNANEAEELAEVATIYKNVGDGIDIAAANESLISTLQGFQMEASEAMKIVDAFNEVANRMPIDSAGIGEALQRSAASFNAANTDLNESIALITATNAVVQEPTRVGNMWKTVSMRIRGATAELEDAGLETEGMVESTSQLRNLIESMTGFDIMVDDDTYKSIKDIVVGIGKEWKNLSDVDQAALLEKLAGKTQANALAAALNNYTMIEEAYEIAQESAGSAMREQEKWEQGLEARTNKLKASLEELSTVVLDPDILGGFIDAGRILIEVLSTIIDKFGLLPTLLTTGGGIFGAFKLFNGDGRLKMLSLFLMNMPSVMIPLMDT